MLVLRNLKRNSGLWQKVYMEGEPADEPEIQELGNSRPQKLRRISVAVSSQSPPSPESTTPTRRVSVIDAPRPSKSGLRPIGQVALFYLFVSLLILAEHLLKKYLQRRLLHRWNALGAPISFKPTVWELILHKLKLCYQN